MKTLDITEMTKVEGGDLLDVANGFCAAVSAGGVLAFALSTLNPVTAAATGFCIGWTIANSIPKS